MCANQRIYNNRRGKFRKDWNVSADCFHSQLRYRQVQVPVVVAGSRLLQHLLCLARTEWLHYFMHLPAYSRKRHTNSSIDLCRRESVRLLPQVRQRAKHYRLAVGFLVLVVRRF